MECKFCHATIEDDAKFCPVCGKSLTDESEVTEAPAEEPADAEAPAEELEATAEEADAPAEEAAAPVEEADAPAEDAEASAEEAAPVTEDELIPGDPNGKPKKGHGLLLAILGVLIAGLVACAFYLSKQAKIPAERVALSGAVSYTVENEAMTDELAGEVVASAKKNGVIEQVKTMLGMTAPDRDGLTNARLSLYYWENFYNYYNQNYYYAMYLGLDPLHMDESMYDEEGNRTWQEYFLSNALEDYRTYTAACAKARAEGFALPEDVQENLDQIRENVSSRSDEELNEQLLSVYGPGVTRENYVEYLENLFLGASYIQAMRDRIEPTDEELSAYYDAHSEDYADVPKTDGGTVNVRHVLIEPEDTEQAESWAAAEKTAQELYENWKAGDATEDSFAELAKARSQDPGSAENGGLYEDVAPGRMVAEFNDWCFDESRKPGDTAVVKTDYGYHIMYFVSEGEGAYWKTVVADPCKNELLNKQVDAMSLAYNLRLDTEKIKLATPGQILDSAVEEEADPEIPEEPAVQPEAEASAAPATGENEMPLG